MGPRLELGGRGSLQTAVREVEALLGDALKPFQRNVGILTTIPRHQRHRRSRRGQRDRLRHEPLRDGGAPRQLGPGLCPRNDESAAKRRSTRIRKGAPWLKTTLVQASWAAIRVKDSYLSYLRAQFFRLKSRRCPMKAIVAVAASILTAAWHMLRDGVPYRQLTAQHFARRVSC